MTALATLKNMTQKSATQAAPAIVIDKKQDNVWL